MGWSTLMQAIDGVHFSFSQYKALITPFKLLKRVATNSIHLMESKQSIHQGANRSAIRCIGQDLQRWRWTVLAHQRPVFQAFWTSLRPDCGQQDHRTGRALPANLENRSNESYWMRHALGCWRSSVARRINGWVIIY